MSFLCRIGWHPWRWVWGSFNRYFECRRCEARMVRKGVGGYQPVDSWWLHRRARASGRPAPSPPAGGWDGYVVPKRIDIAAEEPPPEEMGAT
jgi:hypothetical protein